MCERYIRTSFPSSFACVSGSCMPSLPPPPPPRWCPLTCNHPGKSVLCRILGSTSSAAAHDAARVRGWKWPMLVSYTLRTSMMTCSERHDAQPRGYLRGRTMYLSGRTMCLSGRKMCLSGWASTRRAVNLYKNLHSRCCLFPWPCENPAAQDAPPPEAVVVTE